MQLSTLLAQKLWLTLQNQHKHKGALQKVQQF